jgi:hypothetical protein
VNAVYPTTTITTPIHHHQTHPTLIDALSAQSGNKGSIYSLVPRDFNSLPSGVVGGSLAMGKVILDSALIGNRIIVVVDDSISITSIVLVVPFVFCPILGFVVAFALFLTVHELSCILSLRFNQLAYIYLAIPYPWN